MNTERVKKYSSHLKAETDIPCYRLQEKRRTKGFEMAGGCPENVLEEPPPPGGYWKV